MTFTQSVIAVAVMAALAVLTGCTGTMHDITLTGSVDGIRAYNDGLIGMAKTMVEPKNRSIYMSTRKDQDAQETARQNNPGFWQMMAGAMKGGAK